MKHLWSLAGLIAVLPCLLAWPLITGDTQRFLEFLPMLGGCTIVGVFALILLYREAKDTTPKS